MRNIHRFFLATLLMVLNGAIAFAAPNLDEVQRKIQDKVMVDQLELRSDENKIFLEGRTMLLKDKIEAEEIARKQLKKEEVVNNIIVATS